MNTHDSSDEYLCMVERYRQMSDEELLVLLPQSGELTSFAQQALASEARQRGLKLEDTPTPASQDRADVFARRSGLKSQCEAPQFRGSDDGSNNDDAEADAESSDAYADDRKLVGLIDLSSMRDALQLQSLLDDAEIPFFIGPEMATRADQVTSDFSKGVEVKIMRIGLPWALRAMRNRYFPEDDPEWGQSEKLKDIPVRCPKCHSEEVVFVGGDSPEMSETRQEKFKWECDACGNQWEDDGVVKEV